MRSTTFFQLLAHSPLIHRGMCHLARLYYANYHSELLFQTERLESRIDVFEMNVERAETVDFFR
jgi:hypothetical protein